MPEDQAPDAVVMRNYDLIITPPEILKVMQAASVTCMLEKAISSVCCNEFAHYIIATDTVGWVRLAPVAGVLRLRFVGRSV